MAEPKYKINTKEKLARVADDLEKVLGVRGVPGKTSPAKGEGGQKKP